MIFVPKWNTMICNDDPGSSVCNCKKISLYMSIYISIFEVTILKFKYTNIKKILKNKNYKNNNK